MPFRQGLISYARYRVSSGQRASLDTASIDTLIDALAGGALRPPSVGAPPEIQAGWCAGQHVFDETFDRETMQFGNTLCFGMRIDTNRIPAEIRRAYRVMAEQEAAKARAGASTDGVPFLNRAEKQAARDDAEDRCHRELAEGRFRSSKMAPVLWDLDRQVLFAPTFSDARQGALMELFRATIDASLEPMSSGALASELLCARGLTRDYEDAKPSAFTAPPPNAHDGDEVEGDVRTPTVPWVFAGPEPKDFLGNEFLIWLWWSSEVEGGLFERGDGGGARSIAVALDRVLDMDCAWDATGKQTLRADGPTRLPEARKALRFGKWPRKVGLIVAAQGEQWELTLQGDRLAVTGLKIPKPEGDHRPATPREEVERRIESHAAVDRAVVELFEIFLESRFDGSWSTTREEIATWMKAEGRSQRNRCAAEDDRARDAGSARRDGVEIEVKRNGSLKPTSV